MWMSPDQGLLAGKIESILSPQEIELIDLQGNRWRIDVSDAFWRGRLEPKSGLEIKIMGEEKGPGEFTAREIRPMRGRRGHGRGRGLRSRRGNNSP